MAEGQGSGYGVVTEYQPETIAIISGQSIVTEYIPPLVVSTSGYATVTEFIPVDPRGQLAAIAIILEYIGLPADTSGSNPDFYLLTQKHPGSANDYNLYQDTLIDSQLN